MRSSSVCASVDCDVAGRLVAGRLVAAKMGNVTNETARRMRVFITRLRTHRDETDMHGLKNPCYFRRAAVGSFLPFMRLTTKSIVNFPGVSRGVTSFQSSGVETVASGV